MLHSFWIQGPGLPSHVLVYHLLVHLRVYSIHYSRTIISKSQPCTHQVHRVTRNKHICTICDTHSNICIWMPKLTHFVVFCCLLSVRAQLCKRSIRYSSTGNGLGSVQTSIRVLYNTCVLSAQTHTMYQLPSQQGCKQLGN